MSWFASTAPLLAQAAAAQPDVAFHEEAWFRAVIAALIFLAAWGLGKWLSKVWRMPDYSFRFSLILFAVMAGAVICAWRWPPKLGIDLKGGVILIYEVAEDQQPTLNLAEPLDRVRNYLDNRVKIETQIAARGSNQIAVTASTTSDDTLDEIERTVEGIPFSEFKVSAADRETQGEKATVVFDVASTAQSEAVDTDKLIAALNRRINPGGQKEVVVRKFGERQVEIIIPEVDSHEIDLIKQKISTAGLLEFRILANKVDHGSIIELAANNPLANELVTGGRVVAKWVKLDPQHMKRDERMETRTNRAGELEALVVVDPHNVTGGYLARAATGHDEVGRPAVDFSFNSEGAVAFGELTGENTPDPTTGFHRRLGIILDGRLFSAPELRSAITSRGQITGDFRLEEVQFLVEILNAGHLPAALDKTPVSETSISPQLGADTIRNGSITMIVATAMILVFMLVYYRFSGIVADVAVVLNVLLVVALMITLGAAFTLAGLAGLVLSVGMAVDANVLIYERMREELLRGSALRMAIRNGFSRAMSTIIDSNITTLLSGVVLYAIGTDQLKGFAITLILGLLLNLFTAVYVAHVIFDVAERRRWISELKMMQMFAVPNFDFVRFIRYAVAASLLVIIGGMVVAVSRGEGLFGIDFTGGTSVQIVLQDDRKLTAGEVRNIVGPEDDALPRLEDVTVSSVGLPDADGKSRYYKIDTSLEDIAEVQTRLKKLFGDRLEVYAMNYTPPRPIPGGAEARAAKAIGAASDQADNPAQESQKSNDDAAKKFGADAGKQTPPATGDGKGAAGAPATSSDTAKDPSEPTNDEKSKIDPENKSSPTDNKEKSAGDATKAPSSNSDESKDSASPLLAMAAPDAFALLQDEKQDEKQDEATTAATTKDAAATDDSKEVQATSDEAQKAADEKSAKDDNKTPTDEKAKTDGDAASSKSTNSVESKKQDPAVAPLKTTKATDLQPPGRSTTLGERPQAQVNIFAGGSSTTLRFKEGINHDTLLARLEASAKNLELIPAQFQLDEVQSTRDALNTRLFKSWQLQSTLATADIQKVVDQVQIEFAQTPIFLGANNIGGKVAGHSRVMAVYAMLASMVMIVLYVWVRFQNIVFGLAAVVALVHDVLVTIAALGVSYYVAPYLGWALVDPFKISLNVMAALLTIVGFSINDTIVIFDRIREIKGKSPEITKDMVNKAVNQTLGRTILTSGTVLVVTIILYIWGGQEIHTFAFAMLVGLIAGTYSTVYIASPLVLWLRKPTAARKPASPRGTELAMRV